MHKDTKGKRYVILKTPHKELTFVRSMPPTRPAIGAALGLFYIFPNSNTKTDSKETSPNPPRFKTEISDDVVFNICWSWLLLDIQ